VRTRKPELTIEQLKQQLLLIEALHNSFLACESGCDVYGYAEARFLRECECHGLVECGEAMNAPQDGAKQQPYFGCILTPKGRKLAKKLRGKGGAA